MAFSFLARHTPVALGITLLLVTGCGGGDDGSGGSGGSGGGTTVEPEYDPFPLPAQAWSHGNPSPLEQALLEEIQRARLNPTAEVDVILAVPGVKSAMQQFGTSEELVRSDFMTYAPVPPLSFDEKLMASARAHSEDMAVNGFQDHDSSDGKSFDQRIDAAGYDWAFISENIFAYAESVPYCHAAFMVDWGNPEPGHREAILDVDGEKRDIGISIIEQPQSPDVGPLVVTQDFAMPLKPPANAARYIVGVAYRDLDSSGTYTPGEELAGLSIVPERGDFYAVTSASGGFSVPISRDPGPIKVQLQEDGFVIVQSEIDLTGENVKLDFALPVGEE
jgi:hypothetical protein